MQISSNPYLYLHVAAVPEVNRVRLERGVHYQGHSHRRHTLVLHVAAFTEVYRVRLVRGVYFQGRKQMLDFQGAASWGRKTVSKKL